MIIEVGTLGLGILGVNLFQLKEEYHGERYAAAQTFEVPQETKLEYAAFHYQQWWRAMCFRRGAAVVATAGALGTTWRALQIVGLIH